MTHKTEVHDFFSSTQAKQRASRRLSVARKTNTRSAFDRFIRQTLRNFFNTSLFLFFFKLLGLISVPWYGVVAYPLLWWVCLFLFICLVAVCIGRKR